MGRSDNIDGRTRAARYARDLRASLIDSARIVGSPSPAQSLMLDLAVSLSMTLQSDLGARENDEPGMTPAELATLTSRLTRVLDRLGCSGSARSRDQIKSVDRVPLDPDEARQRQREHNHDHKRPVISLAGQPHAVVAAFRAAQHDDTRTPLEVYCARRYGDADADRLCFISDTVRQWEASAVHEPLDEPELVALDAMKAGLRGSRFAVTHERSSHPRRVRLIEPEPVIKRRPLPPGP